MKERPKTLVWYKWQGIMGTNGINSFLKIMEQVSLFFVVFLFFCSEIYQVDNYKRRALY